MDTVQAAILIEKLKIFGNSKSVIFMGCGGRIRVSDTTEGAAA